jgi:periplasmic mercuric ion binding protein
MKFKNLFLTMTFAALTLVSCKKTEGDNVANGEETTDVAPVMATTSFMIEGMHCEMGCAKAIEKKIAKMDGVQEVEIDFTGKKATIQFDSNKQSPENFVETVEKINKDYIISDVTTSDTKAFLFVKGDKDKKKKKSKEDKKEDKKEETNTTSSEKKSCGSEKSGCCASKKSETM